MKARNSALPVVASAFVASLLTAAATSAPEEKDNPVIELGAVLEPGTNLRIAPPGELPLYVSRRAGRILDTLPPKRVVTVLAIDRYGLQVRGEGRNGPLTGWVGRKSACGADKDKLAKLASFYDRQLHIERLVADRNPAIGMTLHELKRILGAPTSHTVNTKEGEEGETVVWSITEPVDLNESLGLGTDAEVLRGEVEVGRVAIEMVNGLAQSISANFDAGAKPIERVAAPVKEPFGPAPKQALAETGRKK